MTRRIKDLVTDFIVKHGKPGKAQLCKAVKKSEFTLDRWIKTGIPDAHDAFLLLLEIGVEEPEALRMAREEALPETAREPA